MLPLGRAAVIAGIGTVLPPQVVTNDDLAKVMDTSDEWIRTRSGIGERRVADADTLTSDLGALAARRAMEAAGVDTAGAVVLATTTPDRLCPGTAPLVASKLGLGGVPALDVQAVCTGFVYGLATASGLIAAGVAETVLCVAAEKITGLLDPLDRTTTVLFGDGAGAVLLRAGDPDEPGALGPYHLASDGDATDLITVPEGAIEAPAHDLDPSTRGTYLKMDGREVYRRAIPAMAESVEVVMAARGWSASDIDKLVAHQANKRIIEAVAQRVGVRPGAGVVAIEKVGNTAAATIPLALGSHPPEAGERVVMTAFGGGLTWGSTACVWPEVTTIAPDQT